MRWLMGRPVKNVDAKVLHVQSLIASGVSERMACKAARLNRTTFHVRTRKYGECLNGPTGLQWLKNEGGSGDEEAAVLDPDAARGEE